MAVIYINDARTWHYNPSKYMYVHLSKCVMCEDNVNNVYFQLFCNDSIFTAFFSFWYQLSVQVCIPFFKIFCLTKLYKNVNCECLYGSHVLTKHVEIPQTLGFCELLWQWNSAGQWCAHFLSMDVMFGGTVCKSMV